MAKQTQIRLGLVLLISLVFTSLAGCSTPFQSNSFKAEIGSIKGDVQVSGPKNEIYQKASLGNVLEVGLAIKIGDASQADLSFQDGSRLRLGANSMVRITNIQPGSKGYYINLRLEYGRIYAVVKQITVSIETPSAVISTASSVMGVQVDTSGITQTICFSGKASTANAAGSLEVGDGQAVLVQSGAQPPQFTFMNQGIGNLNDAGWTGLLPEATQAALLTQEPANPVGLAAWQATQTAQSAAARPKPTATYGIPVPVNTETPLLR